MLLSFAFRQDEKYCGVSSGGEAVWRDISSNETLEMEIMVDGEVMKIQSERLMRSAQER